MDIIKDFVSSLFISFLVGYLKYKPSPKPSSTTPCADQCKQLIPTLREGRLLTIKVLAPCQTNELAMAVAPKSIRVLVLPQDNPDPGDKPDFRYETLETVRTDIRPSNPAPDDWATLKAVADRQAAKVHMVYYFNESTPQPNVSRLPDFGKTHWHPEAWEKRGVLGTAGYHIFFTLSNSKDLARNRNVGYAVKGDAFIVKLSDTEDDTGRRFYVDLEPGEIKRERLLELVLTVVKYPKSLSLKRLLGSSDVEDNYWEDEQNGADAPHCFYCHAKDAGAVESLDN